MAKAINSREALFVAHYTSPDSETFDNASTSALKAGYSPHSAPKIGWQLLQRTKIKDEIAKIKARSLAEFPKEKLIEYALKDYQSLEVTEPNKPRFLEIAGKASGVLGQTENKGTGNTTNVQININGSETPEELWRMTRKLLGNE